VTACYQKQFYACPLKHKNGFHCKGFLDLFLHNEGLLLAQRALINENTLLKKLFLVIFILWSIASSRTGYSPQFAYAYLSGRYPLRN
jgi:hypothetical protein